LNITTTLFLGKIKEIEDTQLVINWVFLVGPAPPGPLEKPQSIFSTGYFLRKLKGMIRVIGS
jgi:hypothetical protein